jgi:hypothetical protein
MRGRQRNRRQGMQRTQRTQRNLLRAACGLPRAMSPNSPAKKLRPRQPQTLALLAYPLHPPHLPLPLISQAPRTGLAFGQPFVVRQNADGDYYVIQLFHSYNLYFYHTFAIALTSSLVCLPTPTTCSHILVLPPFAFSSMRRRHPELLTVIAVLYCSP